MNYSYDAPFSNFDRLTFPDVAGSDPIPSNKMLEELILTPPPSRTIDWMEEFDIPPVISYEVKNLLENNPQSSWEDIRVLLFRLVFSPRSTLTIDEIGSVSKTKFNVFYMLVSQRAYGREIQAFDITRQGSLWQYNLYLHKIHTHHRNDLFLPGYEKTVYLLFKNAGKDELFDEWLYLSLFTNYCDWIMPKPAQAVLNKSSIKNMTKNVLRDGMNIPTNGKNRNQLEKLGRRADRLSFRFSAYEQSLIRLVELNELISPELHRLNDELGDIAWKEIDDTPTKMAVVCQCQFCYSFRIESNANGKYKAYCGGCKGVHNNWRDHLVRDCGITFKNLDL